MCDFHSHSTPRNVSGRFPFFRRGFRQSSRKKFLYAAGAAVFLLIVLGGIRKGLFSYHYRGFLERRFRDAGQVYRDLFQSRIFGTTHFVARTSRSLKHAVMGKRPQDSPELLRRLGLVREMYGASIVYALDRSGTVVGCTPYDNGRTLTGNNYDFRPYFKIALQGRDIVYPARGVTTGRRGLYYACPVRAEDGSKVIGALVVKMGLEEVERRLARNDFPVILCSPENVAFASNRPGWVYRTVFSRGRGFIDAEFRQYGKEKEHEEKPLLDAAFSDRSVSLDETRYAMASVPFRLASSISGVHPEIPGISGWKLVFLKPVRDLYAPWFYPVIVLAVLGVFGLGGVAFRSSRKSREVEMMSKTLLEQAAETYRTVFNATNDCILILNIETGVILEVNRKTLDLFECGPSEMLGRTLADFSADDPADSGTGSSAWRQKAVREGSCFFEWRIRNKARKIIWMHVFAKQCSINGEDRLLVVMRDITERKKNEFRMQKALETTNAILRSLPTGVMIVGRDRRIRSANDTALRMMGYASEKAVVGKSCDEVCKGDSDRCPLLDRKNVLEHAEGTLLARDGKRIPILKSVLPITLGHEDVLIETFIDITDRQKAQDALRRSKEAAESIIRTKDEFLSTISHEIRTPLNGIIGMLGLLMDSDLTPEQKDYAHTVKKSSDTLLTLINDLLDFSKIEAGKMEMEVMDFDLRLTVDDVCDMMAWKIQQKGLKFTALVHHDVPSLLRGDPGRLRQVLINLVSNAVKFTDEGSVSVRVVLEKEDADSVQLYFTVSDTGIGIPSESRPRMFHVFSQADSSTTRRYGGTGLGLAISRKIVKLMEGEIGYESELGQGSTFWFKVPFLKQKGCSEKIHYGDIRGKKILIVDPNETNRIVMVHRLRNWECRFQEAQDAAQAMECLEEAARVGDPYDIAIVDMQLPDRDGVELAGRIRGDPALSATRLILMTSMGKPGDGGRMKKAGFSGYLSKPVQYGKLFKCLCAVIGSEAKKHSPLLITQHTISENEKKRIRILVAEDNTINQKVALRTLQKFGYRADAVANGQEAVNQLKEIPYDLVFMDIQMPEMDGLEAVRLIREASSGVQDPRVPVIAMTAGNRKDDRKRCLAAGMNDFICKPVEPDEMYALLRKYLHGGSQGERPGIE